jgi:hypothetical protein
MAVTIPRPILPSSISLGAVSPGESAEDKAGAYAPVTGNVTARIDGDPFGSFRVTKISVFDLERDPDAPPGSPLILVPAGSVDGPGPIAVEESEAVLVTVRFSAPESPVEDSFSATAVIVGDGWPAPVQIPASANIAG